MTHRTMSERSTSELRPAPNINKGTKARIAVSECLSECFAWEVGVRQGENMHPLLFSTCLNDLKKFLVANKAD